MLVYSLSGRRFKNYIALLASILFYSWGAPKFVFLVSTVDDLHKKYSEERPEMELNIIDDKPKEPEDKEQEIQKVIDAIKADPNWVDLIKKKAKEGNISFEEAMIKDAKWLVNQNKKE
ncbi:MAG: hypothetical protein ACEPOV_07695 [Hyphomicrobiales bacterium]